MGAIEPGLHPRLGRAAYEAIDAANFSTLKHFARTPAHAREYIQHPPEPTAALELGQAAHCAILEPERFEAEYVCGPNAGRRTNRDKAIWRAFEAEHVGQTLLKPEDHALATALRDAVWRHPTAAALLRGAVHEEVGVVWRHERTGLLVKSLLDAICVHDGWTWILDVKTSRDASPKFFPVAVARFEYHAQAALYLNGCHAIAQHPRRYAWLAIEKERPHVVGVYEPDEEALIAGEQRYERWLDELVEATASGVWPGYGTEIRRIALPRWALSIEEAA